MIIPPKPESFLSKTVGQSPGLVIGSILTILTGRLSIWITSRDSRREAARLLTSTATAPCQSLRAELRSLHVASSADADNVIFAHFQRDIEVIRESETAELRDRLRAAKALPTNCQVTWLKVCTALDDARKTHVAMKQFAALPAESFPERKLAAYKSDLESAVRAIEVALQSLRKFADAETKDSMAKLTGGDA
jgi:hypothetical protein